MFKDIKTIVFNLWSIYLFAVRLVNLNICKEVETPWTQQHKKIVLVKTWLYNEIYRTCVSWLTSLNVLRTYTVLYHIKCHVVRPSCFLLIMLTKAILLKDDYTYSEIIQLYVSRIRIFAVLNCQLDGIYLMLYAI